VDPDPATQMDPEMQCWGYVTFWCGSGSPDPLMDPDLDLDPDPHPDPTPFFIDFKDAKKMYFFIFFLRTCTSSSV
jgi:hypothetical protein